jgi:hypothetical protein
MSCILDSCQGIPHNGLWCSICFYINIYGLLFKIIESNKILNLIDVDENETQYSRNINNKCRVYGCNGNANPTLCIDCYFKKEGCQISKIINYLKHNELFNYISTHNIRHITNYNWKDCITAFNLPIMYQPYNIINLEIKGIKYNNFNFRTFKFRDFMKFILEKFTNNEILQYYSNAKSIPTKGWKLNNEVYLNSQDQPNYLHSYINFIIRLKTTFKLNILMDNTIHYIDIR